MVTLIPPPAVTEPRPVVLLGAMEVDVRRYLVENGSNEDIKFSYCRRGMVRGCDGGCVCDEDLATRYIGSVDYSSDVT